MVSGVTDWSSTVRQNTPPSFSTSQVRFPFSTENATRTGLLAT